MAEKILFDTHAHLNEESIDDREREELIKAIEGSEVAYVMDIGYDLPSSGQAISDADANPWCYAAVGVHPHEADTVTGEVLAGLEEISAEEKAMAIGEIGLDFHYDNSPRDIQREVFRQQIRLANKLRMPMVIHSRDADQETMDILKEEGAFSEERKSWFPKRRTPEDRTGSAPGGQNRKGAGIFKSGESPLICPEDARVQIHCFSGSRELAEQYVKLGATISICGPVTFKNSRKTVEVTEAIPIEYLTIETDSPYLSPEPKRGQKNMSPNVQYVCRRVAAIKGMSYEDVARETLENGKVFFGIK